MNYHSYSTFFVFLLIAYGIWLSLHSFYNLSALFCLSIFGCYRKQASFVRRIRSFLSFIFCIWQFSLWIISNLLSYIIFTTQLMPMIMDLIHKSVCIVDNTIIASCPYNALINDIMFHWYWWALSIKRNTITTTLFHD